MLPAALLCLGSCGPLRGADEVTVFDYSAWTGWGLDEPSMLRQYYDETFLLSCLQGLANRGQPRLFVRYNAAPDDFWWGKIREPGGMAAGLEVARPTTLAALLARFRAHYRGLVVYDENVPATSNVAATVAGADDLLAVRYDPDYRSLYSRLATGPGSLPVVVRLVKEDGTPLFTGQGLIPGTELPTTGSAKNDAYRWLIERYLKPGKLNPAKLGYYIDAFWLKCWFAANPPNLHTLNNLDYLIAHKGIIYDLHCAGDEAPVDDPAQAPGTDLATLRLLLAECNRLNGNQKVITMYGFMPWTFKYTLQQSPAWNPGGRLLARDLENQLLPLLSSYNVMTEADALPTSNFPNASYYQHAPVPERIMQTAPPPTRESLIASGTLTPDGRLLPVNYYAHYAGNYHSSAMLYHYLPSVWTDPERGSFPVAWGFNPSVADRFAVGMLWARGSATANDVFVSGAGGAGVIAPAALTEPRTSGLPGGVPLWEAFSTAAFRRWDIDVIGMVNTCGLPFMADEAVAACARFAPGGMVSPIPPPAPAPHGMPVALRTVILPSVGSEANSRLAAGWVIGNSPATGPGFLVFHSILWRPVHYRLLEEEIDRLGGPPRKLVDLRTLLWLARYARENP